MKCTRFMMSLVLVLAVSGEVAAAPRDDYIARRGSDQGIAGTITRIDDGGVAIRSVSGAEHAMTWDRVRAITSADPSIERQFDQYRNTAESLWRARTRLERGDCALAEPIFARLFAEYRTRSHETALIVAEGLLRCRLARSANDIAIIPALEVARIRRKGVTSDAFRLLPSVYDEKMAMCPNLPPIWVPSGALARGEVDLKAYDAGGDTVVAAIAALYRAAARQQLSLPAEAVSPLAQDHPGVVLMRELVACGAAAAEDRRRARQQLGDRLNDLDSWSRAWAHVAMGLSLLLESGAERVEQGMVHLAHLPAAHVRSQPYLAGMALALLASNLHHVGEVEQAATMRSEFLRLFPNHPAMSLLDRAPHSESSRALNASDHEAADSPPEDPA